MNRIFKDLGVILLMAVGLAAGAFAQTPPLYENNFQKATIGSVPEEFLVLDGGFVVKEEEGNKFLELPGAPLETYGVLFGPTEKENMCVAARIFGTGKGRRFPTFGLGLGGQGGYRLQVAPAKKALELYKADTVVTSAPFDWQPGKWTHLKLRERKTSAGDWKIEGKAWTQGTKEPDSWTISADEKEGLPAGRASVWGSPYAGTPIRFDDFVVARTAEK